MTELVFILDRSGSMSGLEKDTIGGFNSMLEKQRKEPGDAVASTVLFDNETEVIHDRVAIADVPNLTDKEYFVRGCTALLDAVGGAIHHIGNHYTPTLGANTVFKGISENCKIHVPKGCIEAYQTADIWSEFADYMVEMEE